MNDWVLRRDNMVWADKQRWVYAEMEFRSKFVKYPTREEAEAAIPRVAALSGVSESEIRAVSKYGDHLPEVDDGE